MLGLFAAVLAVLIGSTFTKRSTLYIMGFIAWSIIVNSRVAANADAAGWLALYMLGWTIVSPFAAFISGRFT